MQSRKATLMTPVLKVWYLFTIINKFSQPCDQQHMYVYIWTAIPIRQLLCRSNTNKFVNAPISDGTVPISGSVINH